MENSQDRTDSKDHPIPEGEDSRTMVIRYNKQEQSPLDYLNAVVKAKTEAAIKKGLDPNDPATQCYLKVQQGEVIYPYRSRLVLFSCWALVAIGLYRSPSIPFAVGSLCITAVPSDLYSGCLHIVLDETSFATYPIIGRGAVEFFFHHEVPFDLAVRSVTDVCGDINQIVPFLWVLMAVLYNGFQGPDGAEAMCVLSGITLWSYLGIYSHQQAHKMSSDRPAWVRFMQRHGLLLDPELHREHHRYYQDGFPILNGVSSPLLTYAFHAIPNKHIWLAILTLLTFFMFPMLITLCRVVLL